MRALHGPCWNGASLLLAVVVAACGGSKGASEPAGPPPRVLASDVVGPAGGTVVVPDGASLDIPPGALDTLTTVHVTEVQATSTGKTGVYGFEPDGTVFAKPVTVRLPAPAGTTQAFVWWVQPGGGFEPVGGAVAAGFVEAQVSHFSGGYVGDATPTRTVSGSRMITRLSSYGIANVARDLSAVPVRAYVARGGGGYDRYDGAGQADGTFRVPGVPVGPYLLQVGTRYVRSDQDVIDLGEVQPGRRALDVIDPNATVPATFNLSNLAPWRTPASADGITIGDRVDLFSGDSNTWFWRIQGGLSPALATDATSFSGSLANLVTSGSRLVPTNALRAEKGDHLVVAQQHATVSPTGRPYQAMTRTFEPGPTTVAPGTPLSLSGAFADVALASTVTLSWDFGAYRAAVIADANPASTTITTDQFQNRFRVVGQAGGLAYGTHLTIGKPDFLILPVDPASTTTVESGVMSFGTPLQGDWGAHWIAAADVCVTTTVGTNNSYFPVSIRSYGALADTVTLGAPALGLPRAPMVNGTRSLFARQDGVGLTPTLSWTVPSPGPADGYTVQVLRLDGTGSPPWAYVAMLDTSETSLELPAGVLETGKEYMVIIRAYRRGVRVEAPLRIDLPLDEGVQVTAKFTP
jgi:hypothetical protein